MRTLKFFLLALFLLFFINGKGQKQACQPQDSLELLRIYNDCGGADWPIQWILSDSVYKWQGITLGADGYVRKINMGVQLFVGNNLSGDFPDIQLESLEELMLWYNQIESIPNFTGLPSLIRLSVAYNELTAVPDFDSISNLTSLGLSFNKIQALPELTALTNLNSLNVKKNFLDELPYLPSLSKITTGKNRLDFSDLLPYADVVTDYSLQGYDRSIPDFLSFPRFFLLEATDLDSLTFPIGGDSTCYYWYKDAVFQDSIIGDSRFKISGPGYYYCEALNDKLPELKLISNTAFADLNDHLAQDSLELVRIYDACNGPNWTNSWDLEMPISTWAGVGLTVNGTGVDSLIFSDEALNVGNNLSGDFPDVNLPSLVFLELSSNPIESVPDFSALPHLNSLWMSNNGLTSVPNFTQLNRLVVLVLSENPLIEIPKLNFLNSLNVIDLGETGLTNAPTLVNLTSPVFSVGLDGNDLIHLPDYTAFEFAWLFVQNNKLNFDELLPYAEKDVLGFLYAPQDSLSLCASCSDNLSFAVGGAAADITFRWYKDQQLIDTITGSNKYLFDGAGRYRCEAVHRLLPELTLYSREVNLCDDLCSSSLLYHSNSGGSHCEEDEQLFIVLSNDADFYNFYINGVLVQASSANEFTTTLLQNGDVLTVIEEKAGCQYFLSEKIIINNIDATPQLSFCQNSDSLGLNFLEGTAPFIFDLKEFPSQNITTDTVNGFTKNYPISPNGYYEISNLKDGNCTSDITYTSSHISGCEVVCVGYSDLQIEEYSAYFSNRVDPNTIQWEILPETAISNGDIDTLNGLNGHILSLDFSNPNPSLNDITLRATAVSDCGIETLSFNIKLDSKCVWPGDVNDDGQVRILDSTDTRIWIDDVISLNLALEYFEAYSFSDFITYPRPLGCYANNSYDWFPQACTDWQIITDSGTVPALFPIYDNNDNQTAAFNLKYGDCNGDGTINNHVNWDPINGGFGDTIPSDFDVLIYHERMRSRHDGNAAVAKMQNLPELVKITADATALNNRDEIVFKVELGSVDTPLLDVTQIAFMGEGEFGTFGQPSVRLSNSLLSNDRRNLAHLPFNLEDVNGIPDNRLNWYISLKNDVLNPVDFYGEEACSVICHMTIVGAFSENEPNQKAVNDSLGVPVTFKIPTIGIAHSDGSVSYATSNELTIFVQPYPLLAAKVFLEGSYETSTGLMRDDLNTAELLPTCEPYTSLGYQFPNASPPSTCLTDSTVFSITGKKAIVDWVLVEIRSVTDSLLLSYPALLTDDGHVVDLDGVSPISLPRDIYGNYLISIRHRNHLPVLTTSPVFLEGKVNIVDFTRSNTPSQKLLGNNDWGLRAGDANQNAAIDGADRILFQNQNGLNNGYLPTDFDLNRDVNGADRILWEGNNGVSVPY